MSFYQPHGVKLMMTIFTWYVSILNCISIFQDSTVTHCQCPIWTGVMHPWWKHLRCGGTFSELVTVSCYVILMTIQVNLCCLLLVSLRFSTKFTWIFAFKFLSLGYCHLLATTLGYHIFQNSWGGGFLSAFFFYSWAVLIRFHFFVIAYCEVGMVAVWNLAVI